MGRWVQLTDDDPYLFGAQLVTAQLKWCRRWRFDPLKVLYLLRSVAYFPYHESTITHLAAMGHSVEVLADRDRSKDASDGALRAALERTSNLSHGWMTGVLRRPLSAARELLSYASYLTREDQVEFYVKRWERYLPQPARKLAASSRLVRRIIASRPVRWSLRTIERLAPPDRSVTHCLRESRPDVVVASPTNMHHSQEVEYVKAAVALGVPTLIPVLSWDNLTTKGLLHVTPEITLVWNSSQAGEAAGIHGIPADRIVVTGSPFLDKWYDAPEVTLDEAEFWKRVGLAPDRQFVLYLGSSVNIATDESSLVEELADSLGVARDPQLREIQVLVRPHPAHQQVYERISHPNATVWLTDPQVPDSTDAFAAFAAALRYSVCAIGLNTTGMVDAVLADRPVIALLVDRYRDTNASQAVHFQQILKADVYERAYTTDQCVDFIAALLDGNDTRTEQRRRFALDHVRPYGLDVPAGAIAATAIELAASGRTADEINQVIGARTRAEKALVK